MKKLTLIGTALALAFTLSATGCKSKKDGDKAPTTETKKPETGSAAPVAPAPTAPAPVAPARLPRSAHQRKTSGARAPDVLAHDVDARC